MTCSAEESEQRQPRADTASAGSGTLLLLPGTVFLQRPNITASAPAITAALHSPKVGVQAGEGSPWCRTPRFHTLGQN